ncbi:hypothetical protein DC3_40520 [Deinococcus cellulosilyticus NBRC 106333 = KACC 11606]|uniref:Uncharacterized protein n=2 Tax=Deinococcus cellulosilyticus TaxID=401558 RepID=A0A511N7E4_DEIC1|nr:hypothetical protein DC3_40520 [Deinococcus cellulosilyticus NBRC 106333 = KACC 11606]
MFVGQAQHKTLPVKVPVPIKTLHFSSQFRPSQDNRATYHVDISADGGTMAVGFGNQFLSVDLDAGKPLFRQELPTLKGSDLEFYWFAFSPDSRRLALAAKGGKVLFLAPRTGKTLQSLQTSGELVHFWFSPDSRFLCTMGALGEAEIWDLHTFKKLRTLQEDQVPWTLTANSQQVLTADLKGHLRLVSVTTGKSSPFLNLTDPAILYQVSPDGKKLATADVKMPQGTLMKVAPMSFVSVWDTRTQKRLAQFALTGEGRISRLMFADGGKTLVAGTQRGSIVVWNVLKKKTLQHFQAHQGEIIDLELHQDRLYSAAGLGEVKIWDFSQIRSP